MTESVWQLPSRWQLAWASRLVLKLELVWRSEWEREWESESVSELVLVLALALALALARLPLPECCRLVDQTTSTLEAFAIENCKCPESSAR